MNDKKTTEVSLEKWIELSDSGADIPVRTKLSGDSMTPLIRKNKDIVTIIPVNKELKVGQIVAFRVGKNTCIAHRIYKINNNLITTFGDNCQKPDAPIEKKNIVGILTQVERGNKIFQLNTKTQLFYGKIWMRFFRHIWNLYKIIHHKMK